MKAAFKLCDSCRLQFSCETGVALDSFECGREIEIRKCKAYEPYKRDEDNKKGVLNGHCS